MEWIVDMITYDRLLSMTMKNVVLLFVSLKNAKCGGVRCIGSFFIARFAPYPSYEVYHGEHVPFL